MDERATKSSICLDDVLLRYLSETTKHGRRRRFFERGRWAFLLFAALVACQWPEVRSNAAGAVENGAKQTAAGPAAFACPHLQAILTEHVVPTAGLERLRFAGDLLASGRWSL